MSEPKDDLIARLLKWGFSLDSDLGTDEPAGADCREAAATIASLTEQVARLARERDDALATISLLQSQHRKQQEHDTAIIEGLTRDATEAEASRLRAENSAALSNTSGGGKE